MPPVTSRNDYRAPDVDDMLDRVTAEARRQVGADRRQRVEHFHGFVEQGCDKSQEWPEGSE